MSARYEQLIGEVFFAKNCIHKDSRLDCLRCTCVDSYNLVVPWKVSISPVISRRLRETYGWWMYIYIYIYINKCMFLY